MTKIKTMKDWNKEHTERVPFVPRGHVKAIFDDEGNTLDSLMAVQDEKLSELGSKVDESSKEISLVVKGEFIVSKETWKTESGYYSNGEVIVQNDQHSHAYVPVSDVKSLLIGDGEAAGVPLAWKILQDGTIHVIGRSSGEYDINGAVGLALNFFGGGNYTREYTIISSGYTHKEIKEKIDFLNQNSLDVSKLKEDVESIKESSQEVNDSLFINEMFIICADKGEFSANLNTVPLIEGYVSNEQGVVSPMGEFKCAKIPVPSNSYSVSYSSTKTPDVATIFVVYNNGDVVSKKDSGTISLVNAKEIYINFFGEEFATEYIIKTKDVQDKYKYSSCLDKPFDFNGKTALFFGDSITEGVASLEPNSEFVYGLKLAGEKRYSSLLCAKLGLNEINKGISGSSFCSLKNSSVKSITETITSTNTSADFVFVAGGVNDFQTGEPIGKLGDSTNSTFYGCLDIVCNHLSSAYSNSKVVFITPINWCQPTDKDAIASLNVYRDAIFEVATMYGFNVIDGSLVGFPTDSESPFKPIMMYDGCHPTELGHSLYAKTLSGILS